MHPGKKFKSFMYHKYFLRWTCNFLISSFSDTGNIFKIYKLKLIVISSFWCKFHVWILSKKQINIIKKTMYFVWILSKKTNKHHKKRLCTINSFMKTCSGVFKCNICGRENESVPKFLLHCKFHRNQPNVAFECPIRGCSLNFNSFASIKVHKSRVHTNIP
jgi:hypothetical protein